MHPHAKDVSEEISDRFGSNVLSVTDVSSTANMVLDYSRVPSTAFVTDRRLDIFDPQVIVEYEANALEYFLVSVAYMRGHSLYVDARDAPSSVRSPKPYALFNTVPTCGFHNARDNPSLVSRMKNAYARGTYVQGGLSAIKRDHPESRKAMKKVVRAVQNKRYVPIFGSFFSNVRGEAFEKRSDNVIKHRLTSKYFSLDVTVMCSSCQTERFFCKLYDCYDDKNESNVDDVKTTERKRPATGGKRPVTGGKRPATDSVTTDPRPLKKRKLEPTIPFLDTTPSLDVISDIWENHVLNVVIAEAVYARVNAFSPTALSLFSTTSYLTVKRPPSCADDNACAANRVIDASSRSGVVEDPFSSTDHLRHIHCVDMIRYGTVLRFDGKTLVGEGTIQQLRLDDLSGLLETLSIVSQVSKRWKRYCDQHFVWRLIYQCAHTLYNSARIDVTREHELTDLSSLAGVADKRAFLATRSPRVHGLFDCHVFATYAFNVFSSLLFEMINSSFDRKRTDSIFRKYNGYRTLVRYLCLDTFKNWKHDGETARDAETALEACFDVFVRTIHEMEFIDETMEQKVNEMFNIATCNVNEETLINPIDY